MDDLIVEMGPHNSLLCVEEEGLALMTFTTTTKGWQLSSPRHLQHTVREQGLPQLGFDRPTSNLLSSNQCNRDQHSIQKLLPKKC